MPEQPNTFEPHEQFLNSHGRLTQEAAARVNHRLAELCAQKHGPEVVRIINQELGLSLTDASYRGRAKALGMAWIPGDRIELARDLTAARDAARDARIPRWNGASPEAVIANPEYEKEVDILKSFVICRICGKQVRSISGHLASNPPRHTSVHPGIKVKKYKSLFPGAPLYSEAIKERNRKHQARGAETKPLIYITNRRNSHATQKRLVQFAKQFPEDWADKDKALRRHIGIELLSRPSYMSNEELLDRIFGVLDLRRYGSTLEDIRKSRAFLKMVNEVRKWVRRPGKEGGPTRLVNSPSTSP
jgi:hypothetical protein